MTRVAPHVCAVCGDDIWESPPRRAQLGEGDTMVDICTRCDAETPRELRDERHQPRGYTGGGGPVAGAGEFDAGARRVMGDARFERESERLRIEGARPGAPRSKGDVDYAVFKNEGIRIARTGRHNNATSARASAKRDVARKVKRSR